MLFDINEKFTSKMSWSNTGSTSTTTSSTSTTSTTSGGGGGGGGMCGGVAQACYVYPDAPATPGIVTPDVSLNRGIYMNGHVTMDDGKVITVWGFTDLDAGEPSGMNVGGQFPSPATRVIQGQIVHTTLHVQGQMWVHTMHHHGIEPAAPDDGVGHITWDVNGVYTYQWRPHQAGTYYYHCHTNTPLHAEMGMYGLIIIDPPEGPGTLYQNGPKYDAECFWAVDEFDSTWHTLCWDAGTCGEDVGMNILRPDYFLITGVDASGSSAKNNPPISGSIKVGQTLLARYIAAGHHPQFVHLPAELNATVVMSDGRPLPNPFSTTGFRAIAGERYDIIIKPTQPGDYEVAIDIKDWITGQVWGTAKTNVVVS